MEHRVQADEWVEQQTTEIEIDSFNTHRAWTGHSTWRGGQDGVETGLGTHAFKLGSTGGMLWGC